MIVYNCSSVFMRVLLLVCSAWVMRVFVVQGQETALQRLQVMQVSQPLDAAAFSPDGTRLATGGRDHTVRVWDVATGDLLMNRIAHDDWISALAFSPDGQQIIAGSRDDSVRIFDAITGNLVRVVGTHEGDVMSVAVTPDGRLIASGGRDGVIQLWHRSTGELFQRLDHFSQAVWRLTFDPHGRFLASASDDGTIWLWGLWGEHSGSLWQLVGHEEAVVSLAFAPDGHSLLSGGLDGTIHLWDIQDLQANRLHPIVTMSGHITSVMGVGFSENGYVALSASLDGSLRLWDMSNTNNMGQALGTIYSNGAPLTYLTLDQSGAQVATVGTDGIANIWDVGTEAITRLIDQQRTVVQQPTQAPPSQVSPTQASAIEAVAAVSGGRRLVIPSADIGVGVTTFYIEGVTWAIDPWEPIVGHFEGTSWLHNTGNVVIGGHSEMPDGSAGIFSRLYRVGIGDEIFVQDGDLTRRYVVVNIRSVDYRDVSVVYPTGHNRLTLITCDIPSYVAEQNIYYERLVIVADEVPS